ncbi:hypothetical protein EMIT0373P_11676 [Pseudomonas chlororaphis]
MALHGWLILAGSYPSRQAPIYPSNIIESRSEGAARPYLQQYSPRQHHEHDQIDIGYPSKDMRV